jgi:hypothetical protein
VASIKNLKTNLQTILFLAIIMASLSSEVASMSVADSSSLGDTWEVVLGDKDYGESLSVRTEISINSTLVRVIKKGQVFATVGAPTMWVNEYYTRYQLEDGAWISQTEQGTDDKGNIKRPLCLRIEADVYAKKKAAQDAIEEKKELKANDASAAKVKHVEQLVADNTANTATFEYLSENGKPYVNEGGRSIGSGAVSTVTFLKDGTWKTTKNHSWSREEMNGACWGGGYTLDVSGNYFCDGDGNVAGYVTKVNYNPASSGATDDGDAIVPAVHDFIKGTYVNEALTFSFVGNPAK